MILHNFLFTVYVVLKIWNMDPDIGSSKGFGSVIPSTFCIQTEQEISFAIIQHIFGTVPVPRIHHMVLVPTVYRIWYSTAGRTNSTGTLSGTY